MESSPVSAESPRSALQIPIVGFLALGIFVADCLIPLGIGMGSLYIVVVVATLPLKNPWGPKIAMLGTMPLVFLGYWASVPGPGYETAMINRWISILCIVITGMMVLKNIKAQQTLQTTKEDLAAKYADRTNELMDQNHAMVNLLGDMEQVKNNLEDKERRLRLLVDAFPSGMLIVD
ncbi:MAG: hypothetical protein R3B74_14925, partial [Nitrospirales bacterium]|nr:hypothetical protein [Nitrospirales bacterium]